MNDVNEESKPSARKPHRKTRTGCRTCKQRKIKCDEQKPSCINCLKHSVQCAFLLTNPGSPAVTFSSPQNVRRNSQLVNNNSLENRDVLSVPRSLNLPDLELLHNYITSTAPSLHSDPAMITLWKINVPQIGIEYGFVMHGILALSAIHLARFNPARRSYFIAVSHTHHQAGLRTATSLIQHTTAQNCAAVMLFSALTLFFALARPREQGDLFIFGEKGVADWLYLAKGSKIIIENNQDELLAGPLGPMFSAGIRRTKLRDEYMKSHQPERDPLYDLEGLIRNNLVDWQNIDVLLEAIHLLRRSFGLIGYLESIPGFEIGDIFSWVFELNDEFLALVRAHNQEAITVLAYFCAVLKRVDNFWWLEGWAMHLIERVWNILDMEHRLWIRWPVEEIGWIPTPPM